jgi:hypothetical protein
MKKFLAIYTATASSPKRAEWDAMEEGKRKKQEAAGMKAWHDWMTAHGASIVDTGGPLGKTKRISPTGVADTKNNLSGYIAIKAESHEAAAKLFEKHPSFSIFPGEAVEIMEILPIPGQS